MTKEQNIDVIVIGGGPAGSMAARYAALQGVNTLLLEQKKKYGPSNRVGEIFPNAEKI